MEEWSEFFPVQIHHINAVILELINMPETGQLQLTSQRETSRKNKICSTA